MNKKEYNKIKKFVFSEIKKLPKAFCYHNLKHTKDVIRNVEKIARSEKVPKQKIILLKTAALFHDTGFLKDPKNHEEASVKFMREILRKHGYSEKGINEIAKIIMATKMPQRPKTKYEKIICDADLDNFGKRNFFIVTERVRKELENRGNKIPNKKWYEDTLKLMESHDYFTKSARKKNNKTKAKNTEKLKFILKSM